MLVLLFTALLSPMVRALPTWTAATAGEGAWLTGLLAFPVLLAMGWIFRGLFHAAPADSGLAQIFQTVLGKVLGGGLTIIYGIWALFLLCLQARLYGERMLATGYRNASVTVFLAVLLALVLWMGRKKLSAFARATEVFYLALALALGLVLAVSIQDLTPENVLPVWVSDLPGAAAATLVPLGVAGAGVFIAFLGGQITVVEGDRRRCVRWLAAGCLVIAALQFAVLGQLGPDLSAQLEEPFFEVARGVGINGAFQRVESVVVALWAFSDLALLGLLVFACRNMSETLWGERGRKWSVPVVVALTFLGAVFLFPDDFTAQRAASEGVLFGNLLLGFGVPALLRLVQKVKRVGGRAHI